MIKEDKTSGLAKTVIKTFLPKRLNTVTEGLSLSKGCNSLHREAARYWLLAVRKSGMFKS